MERLTNICLRIAVLYIPSKSTSFNTKSLSTITITTIITHQNINIMSVQMNSYIWKNQKTMRLNNQKTMRLNNQKTMRLNRPKIKNNQKETLYKWSMDSILTNCQGRSKISLTKWKTLSITKTKSNQRISTVSKSLRKSNYWQTKILSILHWVKSTLLYSPISLSGSTPYSTSILYSSNINSKTFKTFLHPFMLNSINPTCSLPTRTPLWSPLTQS